MQNKEMGKIFSQRINHKNSRLHKKLEEIIDIPDAKIIDDEKKINDDYAA